MATLEKNEWSMIMDDLEAVANYYETFNKVLSFFTINIFRKAISRLTKSGERVLEIGYGTGEFAKLLCYKTKYFCLDPSKKLLAIAKKNLKCSNVVFIEGLAEEIPIEKARFDRVYCVFAFRDFFDKVRSLREILRVLKRGGKLVILDVQGSLMAKIYGRFVRFLGRLITLNMRNNPFESLDLSIWKMGSAKYYAKLAKVLGFRKVRYLSILGILFILVAVK